jgi:predicted HTH domain antitoxin
MRDEFEILRGVLIMNQKDEMLEAYDFSNGIQGKYAEAYNEGVNTMNQKLILELYKNHKISIGQGAKFLEMDIYFFMKFLNEHKIPAIDDYDIEAELNDVHKALHDVEKGKTNDIRKLFDDL